MAETEVDRTQTPAQPSDVLGVFRAEYIAVTGHDPVSETSYVMPAAQSALETGQWQQMYCWNTGNVTHVSGDGYDYFHQPGGEVNGVPLDFRAYADLAAGAHDQLRLLNKNGVLTFADAGDLDGYIEALAQSCYVGCRTATYDPYPAYKRAMDGLTTQLLQITPTMPTTPPNVPTTPAKSGGGGAPVLLGLAAIAGIFIARRK